ncbi:MAG: hypothetical protein BGP12_09590 [Rhodospirillales bacterium 70-18]|nr:hypothetical protein [Rhodospirillales bacterium]OJY71834.1 MAG: hypothetical protein BGP12_09590 [Rhodospirillales bacterium 70-18]
MAGKRTRKNTTSRRDGLAKPSAWRLQHGNFHPPSYDTDPDTGIVVAHRRAVDSISLMLANGTITREMHDAGTIFRELFRTAALDRMATSQLERVAGGGTDVLSVRQADARRRIAAAMDALGGHDSPAGSCAWFVLGLEFSLRTWATRQGWGGRYVHGPVAQGMVVAALGTLAMHFGLTPRSQAA